MVTLVEGNIGGGRVTLHCGLGNGHFKDKTMVSLWRPSKWVNWLTMTIFRYSSQFSWREDRKDEVEEEVGEEEEEVPESFRVKMVGVVGGRRKDARVRVDKDSGIFTSCGSAEGSSGEEGSRGSVEREARSGLEEERSETREDVGGEDVIQERREVGDAELENREIAIREDEDEGSMMSRRDVEKRSAKRDDLNERRMIRWDGGDQRAVKVNPRDLLVRGRPEDTIMMVREGRQVFREPSTVKFQEVFSPKSGGKVKNQESRKPCTCLHHLPDQNVAAAPQRKGRQAGERRGMSLERGLEERRREKEVMRGREREARRREERRLRGAGDRRRDRTSCSPEAKTFSGRQEVHRQASREGSYLSFTGMEGGWSSRQLEQVKTLIFRISIFNCELGGQVPSHSSS